MTTSASPRGRATTILIADQSAFATTATTGFVKTFVYQARLEETAPLEADPLLGVTRTNDRDPTAPAPGLPTHGGDVEIPMDFNHIGYWLKGLFGAPATTGTTNKVHVFTSGGEVLKARSIEIATGAGFMMHTGCYANRFNFTFSRAGGYQKANVAIVGRSEAAAASSQAGTPGATLDRDPFVAAASSILIDDVSAGQIMEASFAYDNKLSAQDFIGSTYVSGYDLADEAEASGTVKIRFKDRTLYDLAVAGTPIKLEFLASRGTNNRLSIVMPKVRLERTGVPLQGPGLIEQSFNWRAYQDASAAMLTATLKNQVATY